MKILATYSIKGGVGKTTSAVNLAYEAARTGARVLVWDLDPQAAATYFLRVKPRLKGGAERLVSKKGELESHVRGTDFTADQRGGCRLLDAQPRCCPRRRHEAG